MHYKIDEYFLIMGEVKNGYIWKERKLNVDGAFVENEYDNNLNITFVGQYKDEKKFNGKEICIKYDDKLNIYIKFDTEYINGKKYQKEIHFNSKEKIISQYEYYYHFNIIKSYGNKNKYDSNKEKIILEVDYIYDIDGNKKGKGKEYDSEGYLVFKGEYKNGKRNGEGIIFDINKKIIFKGEFEDDKKWNGKEYKYEENIQYEQEYKNGEKKWKNNNERNI